MDHLRIPAGATHVRVPYKCTQFYDGGDFFEYPARQGWSKEELLGRDAFGGRTIAEVEAFFQNWLYFGVLICVLKLQGIEINPSKFLETDERSGDVFVTTSDVLVRNIRAWRTNWAGRNKKRDCNEAKTTQKILEELSMYITLYCGVEGREHDGDMRAPTGAMSWPVIGEISTSMIALGHILGEAMGEIYRRPNMRWGASPMLKSKLLENGWCALDVRRLLADVAIDGQYYLALKKRPYDKNLHRDCTEFLCCAGTINEETYVIKHGETCEGQCKYDTATKDVVRVIEGGGIPVVSWKRNDKGDDSGLVVEDASVGEITYVAISHVWADGLGNPKENSLPVCQLEQIQQRVDTVFPEAGHQPVCFWMDTLCNPVAEEYSHLRKKSIQMMRQIYRRAGAVLVFDAGLQKLPLSSSNNEIAISVYMSNWMHRLWTFQEGMLAKELYFQLKGGPLHEKDFLKDSVKEQEADKEIGLYGSFQFSMRSAALGHFTILRDMVEMKLAELGQLFPALTHAIQQRATTRISDEGICAATIMDTSLDDILAVERNNIGNFPPGIIFHHQKRLKTEGFRWAPKTIMGTRPGDFARDLSNGPFSSFEGKGLRVRYPGFILEGSLRGSGKEIVVEIKRDKQRYRLRLFPEDAEGDDTSPMWDPKHFYAVVMFRSISTRHPTGTDAIVGMLRNATTVHDAQARANHKAKLDITVRINCECRAWVEPLLPEVPTDSTVAAELFGEKQVWRVF